MKPNPTKTQRLTKQELAEWADFIYARYEQKYRKKIELNRKIGRGIMRLNTNGEGETWDPSKQ